MKVTIILRQLTNQVFSLYFTFEFLHLLNLTEGQYCQRFDAFDSFCKELLLLFIAFGPPTKDTKKLTDNLWREIFSRGQKNLKWPQELENWRCLTLCTLYFSIGKNSKRILMHLFPIVSTLDYLTKNFKNFII